ncbi:MAG: Hsp20/alpha crystallin family protein [Betaproteobacteria bacterium]|nr:Hsp20/alpha crystallin family protein [Betaproteobacteria bacterium]
MNHVFNLNRETGEKTALGRIIFSSPRTEQFMDQARVLWNHLYNDARSLLRRTAPKHVHPRIDVLENSNIYDIRVDLPGVDANTIELLMDGKILHLRAKRKCEETTDLKMSICEHKAETYERDIRLADDALVTEKSTTLAEGILSIRIPRKAA